jgi:hypothetical protein
VIEPHLGGLVFVGAARKTGSIDFDQDSRTNRRRSMD